MTLSGRKSRRSRVTENAGGAWGSSSQDFLLLAKLLFRASADYAKNIDGNCSIYALAGIPVLFSTLRCLLLELNAGMYGTPVSAPNVLDNLATSNDVTFLSKYYSLPPALKHKLSLLWEIRNEIVHPAHRPGRDRHNTPAHLASLRQHALLQSTGVDNDYIWISQLQSHKLFAWAFQTLRETVEVLLRHHNVPSFVANNLQASYSLGHG